MITWSTLVDFQIFVVVFLPIFTYCLFAEMLQNKYTQTQNHDLTVLFIWLFQINLITIEKKNDDFRNYFHRNIDCCDTGKNLLLVVKWQEALKHCEHEKKQYMKKDTLLVGGWKTVDCEERFSVYQLQLHKNNSMHTRPYYLWNVNLKGRQKVW